MADRTLTDLTYSGEGIPTHARCSRCRQVFTTPPGATANPEKATRDFYSAFATHICIITIPGRSLVILKHKDKVPILASCSSCHRRFFTIATLLHDSRAAEQYLLEKFDRHDCSGDISLSATQN